MNIMIMLVPAAIALGSLGLAAFVWALQNGQYEDLDGAAQRILLPDEEEPAQHAAGEP